MNPIKINHCPKCKKEIDRDTVYSIPEVYGDGKMRQIGTCAVCGTRWKDVYVYVGSIKYRK